MLKLPISAIVVGLNEAHLIQKSIGSLSFCEEIIYVDLGSRDNSVSLAREMGADVKYHELVPCVEYVQAELVPFLKHNWVIYIDPDEYIDPKLGIYIQENFKLIEKSTEIGSINVPWQFYFINHALIGTPWGGENRKQILVNKNRFLFEPIIHIGRKNKLGFKSLDLPFSEGMILHHYWVQGWQAFIGKHLRYLKKEGKARFESGRKTSILKILFTPFFELKYSYITRKGYKDGILGILLSVFWMFYQLASEIELFKYQLVRVKIRD